MKDKLGHGSDKEAHRNLHKPSHEHGKYIEGTEHHGSFREMSRVRERSGKHVVEVAGPHGWIVQGVHHTKESAEKDRKNWLK